MSNLGWYQILTSVAKKAGGPKALIALLLGTGALLGGGAVACANTVKKKVSAVFESKKQIADTAAIYTVRTAGVSNEGLSFKEGDKFKVLEYDGDAGLIDKVGDENSPYFVSIKFLKSISDYNQ